MLYMVNFISLLYSPSILNFNQVHMPYVKEEFTVRATIQP